MRNLVTSLLLLALVPAAGACSYPQRTDRQLVAEAKSVFRARVTEVKLIKWNDPSLPTGVQEIVEARYEIKEVMKGIPPASGIVRDNIFSLGSCSLGLLPGLEYVFMPDDNDFVLAPSGSFGFYNEEASRIQPRLQSLRKLAAGTK